MEILVILIAIIALGYIFYKSRNKYDSTENNPSGVIVQSKRISSDINPPHLTKLKRQFGSRLYTEWYFDYKVNKFELQVKLDDMWEFLELEISSYWGTSHNPKTGIWISRSSLRKGTEVRIRAVKGDLASPWSKIYTI